MENSVIMAIKGGANVILLSISHSQFCFVIMLGRMKYSNKTKTETRIRIIITTTTKTTTID